MEARLAKRHERSIARMWFFTHADKIREMDDEALAFIIMCPRDDGNKCKNCGDVITCIACCLDWLREPAEG